MDLHFLGAATTVTGSQFLLETARARVVIDCGMFQGSPNEVIRNRVPLAYEPRDIDAILLTHAHLDHSGLIPLVVREGFRGPIYATAGTQELTRLVLLDSGKLQEEFAKRGRRWEARHPDKAAAEEIEEQAVLEAAIAEAEAGRRATDEPDRPRPVVGDADVAMSPAYVVPNEATVVEQGPVPKRRADVEAGLARTAATPEEALRSQPPALEVDLDEPLYTVRDAERSLERFRAVAYDEEREVAPGVFATFLDAGHILGSAIIRLRVREDERERTIVFSGDLGRPDTPIIRDPTVLTHADYVVVESTYGGREHEPQDEAVRILADTVRLVAEHDGVLLVPSFAIGRTQELVWQLDRLLEEGAIPPCRSTSIRRWRGARARSIAGSPGTTTRRPKRLLREHATPLDYPKQIIVNDAQESRAIARQPRPYMIVASNGMLTGGRVVPHLRNLIGDSSAVLLFVGYQGQGTLGAHLQAGATRVKIEGAVYEVRCQVRSISGFSAHADESELLDWVGNFGTGRSPGDDGFPRRVFLVHGDPEAQQALEPKVRALGFETHVPDWHERVRLD